MSPSPLDQLSPNRLPRWMWIVLGISFLMAVAFVMALPLLQASIKQSADSEIQASASNIHARVKSYQREFGHFPPTGGDFRKAVFPEDAATRLLIAKDEVPELFRKDLFESWSPKFGKDSFQILLLHANRANAKTSLWLFKSDTAKPLKLLERPTDEINF